MTRNMPKLRRLPFETAIIQRYRRKEASVEEVLVEMYLAGVSVRHAEDINTLWTAELWLAQIAKIAVDMKRSNASLIQSTMSKNAGSGPPLQ